MGDQPLAEGTNVVRSGVASILEKPQKLRNYARSSSASASLTSERSYQTGSSNALNIDSGGHARPKRSTPKMAMRSLVDDRQYPPQGIGIDA